jgi:hypothetical protein
VPVRHVFEILLSKSDVAAGRLASAVPVRKRKKKRWVLKKVTRKGAGMTENVKGFLTQRRNGAAKTGFPLRRCVAA